MPGFTSRPCRWTVAVLLCAVGLDNSIAAEARWPQFRGPGGSGVAAGGTFPTEFGPGTNLLWRIESPPGHSSPCIWDDHLFLTGWEEPNLEILCLSTWTGERRWQRSVRVETPEPIGGLGSPAAPTSCTDGRRVFSYFGDFGVICHDFDGTEIWRRPLKTPVTGYGVGSSPVLAGDRLILLRDADLNSHLLALDAGTGSILWRRERPEFGRGFSTPLVLGSGKDQIILAPGTLRMPAYRAADGVELWRVTGLPNEICSSPTAGGGLIFAGGWTHGSGVPRMPKFDQLLEQGDGDGDGQLSRKEAPAGPARQHFHYIDANRDGLVSPKEYEFIATAFDNSRNALVAIRPDGVGDVTATHVAWSQARGLPNVPTPLFYDGRLYLVKNGGMVTCLNASDGTVHFLEERIAVAGDNYASPIAADGRICLASRSGTIAVLAAGDELRVLARNPIGEPILATPAIAGDTLFVRSEKHLWAFRDPHGR
jgi:outer membrane protein assembly factor BamB